MLSLSKSLAKHSEREGACIWSSHA
uniref:Uncharacterized protein n=1 Tax=Arundo donax TaxID=35708 RepID=A0A0A9I285_ARUDO